MELFPTPLLTRACKRKCSWKKLDAVNFICVRSKAFEFGSAADRHRRYAIAAAALTFFLNYFCFVFDFVSLFTFVSNFLSVFIGFATSFRVVIKNFVHATAFGKSSPTAKTTKTTHNNKKNNSYKQKQKRHEKILNIKIIH